LRAQSAMPVPVMSPAEAAAAVLISRAGVLHRVSGGDLAECFAAVPDPRRRRGIRHPLPVILGLAVAAVLAGCVTLSDITAWISGAPAELLAALDARPGAAGRRPHPDTVERVFALLGAQGLADHAGAYLMARAGTGPVTFPVAGPVLLPAAAIDGKAVRGAIGPDGLIPYLLAAATHGDAVVIAERLIGPKTNEVPEFQPLLRGLDLAGWVLTMDAGHTVRAHATFTCEELLAHYVMTVKGNTPKLLDTIDGLDWASVPVSHQVTETGHGRTEKRTIQVTDAPGHIREMFPHAAQVFLIERYVTRKVRKRKKNSRRYKTAEVRTAVAVLGITSLSAREAAPEHLAAYVRGHWAIENKIHWVRDVTFREDSSQIRTGSRPRIMATLRNLAIGLIRQAGYTKIAATIRRIRHDPRLLMTILDLHPNPENAS
jgi:predicted transposase YbfD/YdcC